MHAYMMMIERWFFCRLCIKQCFGCSIELPQQGVSNGLFYVEKLVYIKEIGLQRLSLISEERGRRD